jgi:hypothetical protein
MKNLLNPRWLFLINTLPIVVLFLLEYADFQIIKTLLSPESLAYWRDYTTVLAVLWVINLVYMAYAIVQKTTISPIYSLFCALSYSIYLYFYCMHANDILPFSIPQWMISDNIMLYAGSFLMPTIAHAMLSAVVYFTPEGGKHSAMYNFGYAISIPITWFFFSMLTIQLSHTSSPGAHALTILMLSSCIAFLFFLVRAIYIITFSRGRISDDTKLLASILIGIVFPLLGLLLNKAMSSDVDCGFFGNFNSLWFFLIALINGILVCLPKPKKPQEHLVLFVGKSIGFVYTLYFFFIFLPYLPFAIFAILVFGAGFLILTPLMLFVIQSKILLDDFEILQQNFTKKTLKIWFFASLTVLPLCVVGSYWHDRNVLHEALSYVYTPNYTKNYDLDESAIQRTLRVVKKQKDRNGARRDGISGTNTPYLSALYSWLVLDNMTLSDAKTERLERIFVGKTMGENKKQTPLDGMDWGSTRTFNRANRIDDKGNALINMNEISATTRFDSAQNVYKTWIDLDLENTSEVSTAEFATVFDLPQGCFISDYYLYIGNTKETGLLVERKAAMWVYQQIASALVSKDPGLLSFLPNGKVELKVFPFAAHEKRKTGFEIMHKMPFSLNLNKNLVAIQCKTIEMPFINDKNTENELKNTFYIDAVAKKSLKTVERMPYLHFIVDISNKNNIAGTKKAYKKQINAVLDKNWISPKNAQISFTNAYANTQPLGTHWEDDLDNQDFENGFFAEYALKKALFTAYTQPKMSYPVFVLVSNDSTNIAISDDWNAFAFAQPEQNPCYYTNELGELLPIPSTVKDSFISNPQPFQTSKVLAFPNSEKPIAFLTIDENPSIVLRNNEHFVRANDIKPQNWASGVMLQGETMDNILHPETTDFAYAQLVQHSFAARILSPFTAFMVVENEAQKAMLLKKQAQVMAGNKSLDLGEEPEQMSEPNIWILLGLLVLLQVLVRYFK